MPMYYLNPNDEPRDCPGITIKGCSGAICNRCHGTGRLGVEGAEPDVEVEHFGYAFEGSDPTRGFRWRLYPPTHGGAGWSSIEPTEAAALEAARLAHKGDWQPTSQLAEDDAKTSETWLALAANPRHPFRGSKL